MTTQVNDPMAKAASTPNPASTHWTAVTALPCHAVGAVRCDPGVIVPVEPRISSG